MNANIFPQRALYWKEFRQVTPLVLMLLGVALVLIALWSGLGLDLSSRAFEFAGHYIPLILPALYAAGAGAILVGQEKETRTLLWFSSLPVPALQIIRTKFIVALAGLAVMWLGCWFLMPLTNLAGTRTSTSALGTPMQGEAIALLFWLTHSVFVLCCGFYTAWKLKNAFASLIAILPLACIPFLLAQIYHSLLREPHGRRFATPEESAWVATLITVVAIAVIGWLAYRAATKDLSPAEPETPSATSSAVWLEGWRPAASIGPSALPFRLSLMSLVWQSIHHNRLVLAGLTTLVFFGVVCLAVIGIVPTNDSDFAEAVLLGGVFAGLVGMSWLGVFAFTGDGSAPRLRFLADRGISPSLAWIGRQSIGISIIASAILLYAVLSLVILGRTTAESTPVPVLSVATLASIAWIIYAVSQWTSQVIRILAASAFVAPALSGIVAFLFGFAATELDAPFWLLFLCSTLPIFATWAMMRRFMDNHELVSIWGMALAVGLLLVVLPVTPAAIEIASWPRLSGETRQKLIAAARQVPDPPRVQSMMRKDRLWDEGLPEDLSGDEALALAEKIQLKPRDQLHYGADDRVALRVDAGLLETAIAMASLAHLRYESAPDDPQARAILDDWVEALTLMSRQFRNSNRWLDQEAADATEIWLTQTLTRDAMRGYRHRENVADTLSMLADQPSRSQARRRAVLATWRDAQLDQNLDWEPGGFRRYEWLPWVSSTKRGYLLDRMTDRLVLTSLRLIDAGQNGQPTEALRQELHQLILGPTMDFRGGPYSDRIRVGTAPSKAVSVQQTLRYPANQWYAAWEAAAIDLAAASTPSAEISSNP